MAKTADLGLCRRTIFRMLCGFRFTNSCGTRRCYRTDTSGLLTMRAAGFLGLYAVFDGLRLNRSIFRAMFRRLRFNKIVRHGTMNLHLRRILRVVDALCTCNIRCSLNGRCAVRHNRRSCGLRRNRRRCFRKIMRQGPYLRRDRSNSCGTGMCRIAHGHKIAVREIVCVNADVCILMRHMGRCSMPRRRIIGKIAVLLRIVLRTAAGRCRKLRRLSVTDLSAHAIGQRAGRRSRSRIGGGAADSRSCF